MNTRPKPGEDEDDLLKLQEQFLASASGGRPTVSIKRPDKRKTDGLEKEEGRHVVKMEGVEPSPPVTSHPAIPAKKSKFKLDTEKARGRQEIETRPPLSNTEDVEDMEELVDRHDRGLAAVLTTIIERDTRNEMCMAPVLGKQAFPKAIHVDRPPEKTETGKIRKKSLFAQQVEAHSSLQFGVEPTPQRSVSAYRRETQAGDSVNSQQAAHGSCIVEGIGLGINNRQTESLKIHDENVEKLAGMSEADIIEEQQKLLEMLDPKLIQFLRNKRKAKEESTTTAEATAKKVSFSVQREIKQKSEAAVISAHKVDLPVKRNKNWVNMGTIEGEKLEWMKDLPPPSSVSSQTGRPARFDFQGNIMAVDADVPVNLGLHHHGEEPERAGYTLEEIFLLARSSNLQQRIIALHTLARIITQAKSGYLREKIETPIIPAILAGGVVMLLRWALDDTVEGTVAAAVDALHALLCSPLDEQAADITWAWFQGNLSVALTPTATLEKEAQAEDIDEENKEEETDADVIRRDVIQALVNRMELLIRFRYIFQSMRPRAATVVQMLEILTRVAQHSGNMAYEILKCPGLVDTVMREFLPTAWNPPDCSKPVSSVYGLPVPAAMHLMQVLCQAGRNMASILVSKYHLSVRLLRYLALPSSDLHLPLTEAVDLQRESLGAWRVCVSYGLAVQIYFDLYSNILLSLGKLEDRWLLSCEASTTEGKVQDLGALDVRMICVLEKMLCVAGNTSSTLQDGPNSSDYARSEETSFTSASWSHVTELLYPIKAFTTHVLRDLSTSYPAKKQRLDLPTACLNFLATYYELEGRQSGIDAIASLDNIEQFCNTCIIPLWSSHGLSVIIDSLSSHSNLLAPAVAASTETASNLPSLCVCKVPDPERTVMPDPITTSQETWKLNMPVLLPQSPMGFLVALLRLMLAVCRRHKSLIPQLMEPVVCKKDILVYMAKTCSVDRSAFHTAHFTGGENFLHYYWLKCCTLMSCQNMSLAHRVALQLVTRVQHGNEHLVHDLISTVVFSPSFLSEGEDPDLTSEALEGLNLSENLYIISATQEEISLSEHKLLQQTYLSLAKIRGHYLQAFGGMEKALQDSRNLFMGNPREIQSQLITGAGESLMPRDWMFLPLIHVYNKAAQTKSVSGGSVSPQGVAMVTSVLQWTYALEVRRPTEMDQISVTLRLTRVMCAFIAGNDLFLEKPVSHYLAGLLRVFATQKHLEKLDFDERVPGITSFYDLYQEFLEHYEGVSFGDPVFGLYVLLPLQQRHSSLLRKAVWGERRRLLRTLRVSLTEMLIPLENYLQPEEQDMELLQLYLSAVITKGVQSAWSPVMYLIAIHHINRFIYVSHDDGNEAVRSHMWGQILAEENKPERLAPSDSKSHYLDEIRQTEMLKTLTSCIKLLYWSTQWLRSNLLSIVGWLDINDLMEVCEKGDVIFTFCK